ASGRSISFRRCHAGTGLCILSRSGGEAAHGVRLPGAVHASAAVDCAPRSAAVAGRAALVEGTDRPAGPAVAGTGLLVDAGVAADGLAVGADAPASGTRLAGEA